ncbi:MAG: hypothetical protein KAT44_11640, partial [Pirellulales bacterium]|nr:hypothetical protein [Pirellulales bacterium]
MNLNTKAARARSLSIFKVMPAEISNQGRVVVDGLEQEAYRLGFSRVGITSAEPPPRHERFAQWLDQG